ncbi:MAG: hypothetical protein ACLFPL_03370 [Candidatus Nanoarchaeia archaeon]
MLDLMSVGIGIMSVLFVFLSTLLSKLSFDETQYQSNLKIGGIMGVLVLSLIVGVVYEFYVEMLLVFLFSVIVFTKMNSYYTHRSSSYVLIYILLFMQPIFASFVALIEFFNLSFTKQFNVRFELLLLFGFLAIVLSVFFFS